MELKEQKVNSLTAELSELTFSGSTEEDVGLLKKAKHQLQNKVKEQVCLSYFNLSTVKVFQILAKFFISQAHRGLV